jgi:serine-type D-Ala-D-Ala carboxypeptidase/endopeptidase (penicillin-binding protein 4)
VGDAWAALPAPVSQALRVAGVPERAMSLYVREVGREKTLVDHRGTAPMNPASTMKIVTTLVGLDVLTPAYTWKTEFLTTGAINQGVLTAPLIIRGSGDPKFTWEHLRVAVVALRNLGIKEIAGEIGLDRSRFAVSKEDPAQFDGQPLRPYNVAPDALLYNFKSVGFKFAPQLDSTVTISTDGPVPDGLTITNRLRATAGNCGDWRAQIAPAFDTQGSVATATFTGTYPASCADRDWYVSLFDHSGLLTGSFARLWRDAGGGFAGKTTAPVKDVITPKNARLLYTHVSAPLTSMVSDINKFSNNVMARQLLLSVDATLAKPPARTTRATQSIRAWAKARGFDVPDLLIENGSGLSRNERISAKSLAAFLEYGLTANYAQDFVQSLPVAAIDGTLSKRFNQSAADGNAFLKTGTLTGAKSLAGYLRMPDGKLILFVAMVNHANAESSTRALDSAVEWVYQNAR